MYSPEIMQIHNSVDAACVELSEKMYRHPKELEFMRNKAKSLSMMGFRNSSGKMTDVEDLEYYNSLCFKFPGYKIIDQDDLVKICKKYDLVNAPIDRYVGFVPAKNLSEIETFFMAYASKQCSASIRSRQTWQNESHPYDFWLLMNDPEFDLSSLKQFDEGGIIKYVGAVPDKYIGGDYKHEGRLIAATLTMAKPSQNIAAPRKDLDLTRMRVDESTNQAMEIPDPIVTVPIRKNPWDKKVYCIVVTKWGDEASDPIFFDQTQN